MTMQFPIKQAEATDENRSKREFLSDFGGSQLAGFPTPVISDTGSHGASSFGEVVQTRRMDIYTSFFKRLIDVALVIVSLPIVLPFIVVFGIAVSLDGHGPLYSQLRVGKGGRSFRLWKLRTMVKNADSVLEAYLDDNPAARREWERDQKLKNDPRVTVMGRILRRSSLDELPQLWNVLIGDMSLVGPRPMMVSQKSAYPGTSYYRISPGITGLWQISDRNECGFAERVRYDDIYVQSVSFTQDLKILLKTVFIVIRGTGY